MWPAEQWTPRNGVSPIHPQCKESPVVQARDQAFRVHNPTYNFSGSVTPVPGESQLSTSVSIDFSLLMTKAEAIIETPRDPNWN